jgi:hypothetical protein
MVGVFSGVVLLQPVLISNRMVNAIGIKIYFFMMNYFDNNYGTTNIVP